MECLIPVVVLAIVVLSFTDRPTVTIDLRVLRKVLVRLLMIPFYAFVVVLVITALGVAAVEVVRTLKDSQILTDALRLIGHLITYSIFLVGLFCLLRGLVHRLRHRC